MTVYARSDVCYVGISADHGGCGEGHSRPVVDGAPAKLWALTCHNGCEDFLRSDPLWASKPHAVPETPDETVVREDVEKRGNIEQAEATAHALTNLARLGELPRALAEALATSLAPLTGGHAAVAGPGMTLLCANGHANASTAKFCAECGVSTDAPVASDRGKAIEAGPSTGDSETVEEPPPAPEPVTEPQGDNESEADDKPSGDDESDSEPEPEAADTPAGMPDNVDDMSMAELKELAKQVGVKTTRSRDDQIAALREHFAN